MNKKCIKCDNIKPNDHFYRNRNVCKQCRTLHQQQYFQNNKEKWARYRLKTRYNLTPEGKEQMLINQNYCCAGCLLTLSYKTAVVDHCHKSSKVRGLLCND